MKKGMAAGVFLCILLIAIQFGLVGGSYADRKEQEEVKRLAELENIGTEVAAVNQTVSAGKRIMSSSLPSYTKLYPDLFVEPSRIVYNKDLDKKKIAYLTFDDGPSKNTKKILEILEKNKIKATFFVVGSTMDVDDEKQLKEMSDAGYSIGIHTYSHNYKEIYASVDNYLKDFDKVYQKIYQVTGEKPRIFRFPGGSINAFNKRIYKEIITEMERRGFTYFDWNVSGEDAVGHPTSYSILKNIDKFKRFNEPVVLLHDGGSNKLTAEVLPDVIAKIREEGYDFDVLDRCKSCQFGRQ